VAGPMSAGRRQSAQQPETLNEVDVRVRNVGLGSRYSTVLRQFGRPWALERENILDDTCGDPHTSLRLKYAGFVIELRGDIRGRHFTVVSIEINSPQKVVSPVHLAMTEKHVRSLLGSPWQERNESAFHILYYVTKANDGVVLLSFRAGKLSKIHSKATLC
jgi:hypothetical protein